MRSKKKTFNEQQNLIKVIKLVFKCTLHLAFLHVYVVRSRVDASLAFLFGAAAVSVAVVVVANFLDFL